MSENEQEWGAGPSDSTPMEWEVAARDQFNRMVAAAPAELQKSAEKWSAGLIAIIGLVTGGMLLRGPASTSDMPDSWRWTVIALNVVALFLAVLAVWRFLTVTGRRFRIMTAQDLFSKPGAYEHEKANAVGIDARTTRRATTIASMAITLLVVAITVGWVAPTRDPSPAAFLDVATATGSTCGALLSADHSELRMRKSGERDPRVLPLGEVVNIRVLAKCP